MRDINQDCVSIQGVRLFTGLGMSETVEITNTSPETENFAKLLAPLYASLAESTANNTYCSQDYYFAAPTNCGSENNSTSACSEWLYLQSLPTNLYNQINQSLTSIGFSDSSATAYNQAFDGAEVIARSYPPSFYAQQNCTAQEYQACCIPIIDICYTQGSGIQGVGLSGERQDMLWNALGTYSSQHSTAWYQEPLAISGFAAATAMLFTAAVHLFMRSRRNQADPSLRQFLSPH